MKLDIYQIDAFAEKPFEGNPAAVVPLNEWLSDETMQAIAEENNLSETAFFVPTSSGYHIRWFTPASEVKLCGHATLASAYVLFEILGQAETSIAFDSLSGALTVTKSEEKLTLDFPAQKPEKCEPPEDLIAGLGKKPTECYKNEDFIAIFDDEQEIAEIEPDQTCLEKLGYRGVIVTAPSKNYDFVARFFAPKYGIPEDPVTGSAYTQLTPLWATKMDKKRFNAKQISKRGGKLFCELKGDRVLISGSAIKFMEGTIEV